MLKHTALHDLHKERGAKLAPFAGFDMPLYYGQEREGTSVMP